MTSIGPSITSSIGPSISDSFGNALSPIDHQVLINELGIKSAAGVITSWDNQGDSAFDLDVILGTGANLKPHPTASMLLYGASGDFASTPDSPALELTGAVQTWICTVYADDYTPSATEYMVAQFDPGADQRSWSIGFDDSPSGSLVFQFSLNGTGGITANSTESPSFTNGNQGTFKIERTVSTGVFNFSELVNGSFQALGDPVTRSSGALHNSIADLTIGARLDSGGSAFEFSGAVKSVQVYDDSRLALDFQASQGENKTGVAGDTFVNVFGDEFVTNGTNLTDTIGWAEARGSSTLSAVGGRLRITSDDGSTMGASWELTGLTIGDFYQASADMFMGDITGTSRLRVADNSALSTGLLVDEIASTDHFESETFQATATTLYIGAIFAGQTTGQFGEMGNISLIQSNTWTMAGNTFIQNTGHTVVNSIGSAGLETTVGQLINTPMTIFMVAKANALTGAVQRITDARSNFSSAAILEITAADAFGFNAGASISAGAGDTSVHLHTARYNGDLTTSYEVSGVGIVTANAGSESMDFGTIFSSEAGTATFNGFIAEYIIYPRQLSDFEIILVQSYLTNKWNL